MPETIELFEVDIQPSLDSAYSLESASILDEKNRIVAVTLITVGPGNTRDKNFYSQEAISKGSELFDGAKCFANHPSLMDQKIQPERRVQDIIGWFSDVKVEGEALKANLHITPGENAEWSWPLIKESIAYAKKYPGKKLSGLSINARGAQEPMKLNGEDGWKNVTQFLEVRSVDLVTEPARGGKFETVLSESEAAVSASEIFNAIKEKVGNLNDENYPEMENLRRMLDQLGTELKFNKTEESEMPNDKPKDGEEMPDFAKMASTYAKAAKTETDPALKGFHMKASEVFKKMAETAEAEAKNAEAEAKKKESEGKQGEEDAKKKEAESIEKKKEGEAKQEEADFKAKYIDLKKETLMSEAGLSEAQVGFISNLLEGVTDLEKIEKTISGYAKVTLEESATRKPHNFEKRTSVKAKATKSAADRMTEAFN